MVDHVDSSAEFLAGATARTRHRTVKLKLNGRLRKREYSVAFGLRLWSRQRRAERSRKVAACNIRY